MYMCCCCLCSCYSVLTALCSEPIKVPVVTRVECRLSASLALRGYLHTDMRWELYVDACVCCYQFCEACQLLKMGAPKLSLSLQCACCLIHQAGVCCLSFNADSIIWKPENPSHNVAVVRHSQPHSKPGTISC